MTDASEMSKYFPEEDEIAGLNSTQKAKVLLNRSL